MTTITVKSSFNSSFQGLSKMQIAHAVAELSFNTSMLARITSAKVFMNATTLSISYEIGPKVEPKPEAAPKRTRTRQSKAEPKIVTTVEEDGYDKF